MSYERSHVLRVAFWFGWSGNTIHHCQCSGYHPDGAWLGEEEFDANAARPGALSTLHMHDHDVF